MLHWLKDLVLPIFQSAHSLANNAIAFFEWYSHSSEIKFYKAQGSQDTAGTLYSEDDDEEALEDFDIYFNEYDWETEKQDNV
jgi:hypothetical protein